MHGGWVVANATGGWHLDYWLCELVRDSASFNCARETQQTPALCVVEEPLDVHCLEESKARKLGLCRFCGGTLCVDANRPLSLR